MNNDEFAGIGSAVISGGSWFLGGLAVPVSGLVAKNLRRTVDLPT